MRHLALLSSMVLLAAPAAAHAKKRPRPGLKVHGISVNSVFVAKGTTVEPEESTNTCYRIGGPSGAPQSLQATVYVRAIKIPKTAVMHYEFHVPWDKAPGVQESDSVFDGPFGKGLFRSKPSNAGGAFGGPTGAHDHFTYRMLPTGTPTSYYLAGDYSFKVTARAGGRTYAARGKITLQCA